MGPLDIGLTAVGTAAKLASIPGSIRSQRKLERDLSALRSTPMARYTIDPKIENLYRQSISEASNPRGFGGATYSGFRNNLGRIQRGRFVNAINMSGGQGSRAINSVLQGQELDALGNYYTADENLRRSNRLGALGRAGTYANQFQNIRNQNASNDIRYRMMLEQGLGEGIRSQKDFRRNMFSSLGSDLITSGLMGAFGSNGSSTGSEDASVDYSPEGTSGTDFMYIPSQRAAMSARTNRLRQLGAYK